MRAAAWRKVQLRGASTGIVQSKGVEWRVERELRPAKNVGASTESYRPEVNRGAHHYDASIAGWQGGWDLQVRSWSKPCVEGQLTDSVQALDNLLQQGNYVHDSVLYRVLQRCNAQKDLVLGARVHALCVKSGHEADTFLANLIIRMYASHGRLEEAMEVFTKVPAPDTYMWASIISAHADHGQPKQVMKLYRQMCSLAVKRNSYVYVAVLKVCAAEADLASGKQVHADYLGSSVEPDDVFVGNCLVRMYAKCGSLEDARKVFDRLLTKNVVTWNTLLAGYAEQGLGEEALSLYGRMQDDGVTPANAVTFTALLKACARMGALNEGKQLHAQIQDRGLDADVVVGSSLVDMYAKCGSIEDARRVFDRMPTKNVITWTAMIAGYAHDGLAKEALSLHSCMQQQGITPNVATWNALLAAYAQHGLGQEALALYASMQQDGLIPANHVTFVCLLKACASVGALHQGKELHLQIQKRGLEGDVVVGNCLVNMYAKCGSLADARTVFDRMPTKDVSTWNSLINGYGQRNDSQKAIGCFQEMQQHGVDPDPITFICILVACSHAGLVNEGRHYFKMMEGECGIVPCVDHYNCMVDLLGRSRLLDEAETMVLSMPFQINTVGWMALLNACRSHNDIQRGKRCFDTLIQMDPQNAAPYVLMANIYSDAGSWEDVYRIERLRKLAGAGKKPASAFIEVRNKVHSFAVGEERDDISSKLKSVNALISKEGSHIPHTELVLKPVSDPEKEDALCGHAEKLALAYGLLNTRQGETLLVTKNLRMCGDCHSGTKIMSKIEKREIIVRDAHRVHHFVDGSCSCGDRD